MEFNADKYKIFDTILKNEDYQNEEIIEVIGKALSTCLPFTWEKINKILLNIIIFNEKELKMECYKGLPDLPSLRALIWKINFRYLPHDTKKWKNSLESKRQEYLEIKNAFILRKKEEIKIFEELEQTTNNINNKKIEENKNINYKVEEINNETDFNKKRDINKENNMEIKDINNNNVTYLSSLAECTDRNLLEIINKDINRTHIYMNFFNSIADKKNKLTDEEQFKLFVLIALDIIYMKMILIIGL